MESLNTGYHLVRVRGIIGASLRKLGLLVEYTLMFNQLEKGYEMGNTKGS